MIRDFKYILKRIIIGVGIALVLGFLRGNLLIGVSAKEISSVWAPLSTNTYVVNNMDTSVSATSSGRYWANWGYGVLRFNFSLIKVSGSSTSALVVPKDISANSYACNVGTTSTGNSTFTGSTYSAECPMLMGSNGLTSIYIGLTDFQTNSNSDYRITFGGTFTFEKIDDDLSSLVSSINSQTSSINSNIDSEIQSQTQTIINNQNTNTQNIIDSLNNCSYQSKDFNKNNSSKDNYFIGSNGSYTSNTSFVSIEYIPIKPNSDYTLEYSYSNVGSAVAYCLYNESRVKISCTLVSQSNSFNSGSAQFLTISVRNGSTNKATLSGYLCSNKLDDTTNAINSVNSSVNQVNSSVNNINNNINNTNVSEANSEASSFFDNFNASSHGISGIITAPIRLLNAFTTASCSPLEFNLPFVGNHVVLPCMKGIYESYFGVFFTLWQMITTGVICWNVGLNFYKKIRDLQNPKNDRIEVLSL